MLQRLRQYDVYTKGVEGIQERTTGGAIITLTSLVVVLLLFLSELGIYTTTEVANRMYVDVDPQDTVMHVEVDITFLHEPCSDVAMDASDTKGNREVIVQSDVVAYPLEDEKEGCRFKGFVDLKKIAGDINFAHEGSLNMFTFLEFLDFNSSHIVHSLRFGPSIPNMVNPLENVHKVVIENFKLYKYRISIVPTQYTPLYGSPVQTYQYSVTEHASDPNENGRFSFPGVAFSYEFSPIKVEYIETKPSFLQFLTSTCAIVGGVFAVARILDGFVYSVSAHKVD
ncbi:endoplasmic reticulum-Golgi intermediate compartment protein [Thraustotheca clavata]|uniref:Endoplasmic reticulum-Golgi intermediate compartment protein n=1 Tax=Thraustotheca clavata TaxID=74557 RepID=A0A1W0A9T6_9STRA|nr:endoplasmic reticulum-Golgi intermediate compartment protein [Thraustotheca clavata]